MAPGNTQRRSPGAGDMFFKVKGAKHGDINGEAQDQKHKNEIEVLSWSWGMQGKASIGSGAATGKATMRELRIVKKVDKASTALMARASHERGDQGRGADPQEERARRSSST